MTEPTSSSGGATPATGSPVTGTPASEGVTPQTPSLTLEEALKKIAELEHAHKNAKETADRHAKSVAKYEQAQKEAELAKLGDLEKAQSRAEQAEKQIQTYKDQLVTAQIQLQATARGIANAELISPYVQSKLELDDDGKPTNLDKVLDEVIKANPNLVVNNPDPGTPAAQTANRAPRIPAMTPDRSSIQRPGQAQPGRVPGWHEVYPKP